MTDKDKPREEQRVWCRRIERSLPVTDHADCPYCFGRTGEIATGEHADFCGFEPGRDPINFGFPADTSRNLE